MSEYIYRVDKDINGVNVFLLKGELVRCKDCRYYGYPFPDPKENADAYPERRCCLLEMGEAFGKDDFCSYGERKYDDE